MLFVLSLLVPLLVLSVWIFWRLSPPALRAGRLRAYNLAAVLLGLGLAAALAAYVRASLEPSGERALWPLVAAFYAMAFFPLWLALAGGLRRLLFGARPSAEPLQIHQDLSQTRF